MGKEEKSKQTDNKAHKKTAFYLRKGPKKKTGTKPYLQPSKANMNTVPIPTYARLKEIESKRFREVVTKLALCLAFWRLFAIYWMGEMGGQSVERHPSAP